MRIYSIISIAQLEPAAIIVGLDLYKRKINMELLLVYNKDNLSEDEVERVLEKRIIAKEKIKYLIK